MNIKNHYYRALAIVAMAVMATATASAQEPELLISFKTTYYEQQGSTNNFSIVLGGTDTCFVDVDCGYGAIEAKIIPASVDKESETIKGTEISCQVSSAGPVKIYGERFSIEYFNGDGCYITDIKFYDPTPILFLSLNHNVLESLDLSELSGLQACYLSDNPYDKAPLKIGGNKPLLTILDISITGNLDQSFNLSDYPSMASFDAMYTPSLTHIDPSGCPDLLRLSIDDTGVSSVDVSKNSELRILNVSGSYVTSLDLSKSTNLGQLYIGGRRGKFSEIDLSHCPNLYYLFAHNNQLTSLDVTHNPHLNTLWAHNNNLSTIDLSNNKELSSVNLSKNYFDFNTLPLDQDSWLEYEYTQNAMSVPRSYCVNTPLDLRQRVMREGSQTWATVFGVSEDDPQNPYELDPSQFTFTDEGLVIIHEVIADSVIVAYANSLFPYADLQTCQFKVKSQEEYGLDDLKFTFTPAGAVGSDISMSVGIAGATAQSPIEFYVDYGDGNKVAYTATSATMPAQPNVTAKVAAEGKLAKLYVKDGSTLTALAFDNTALANADVTAMKELIDLRMTGTSLQALDLQWNRCLQSLQLNGNNFGDFSLRGNNPSYGKNVLTHIDLSGNGITSLQFLENVGAVEYYDISHNSIETMNFTDCERMSYVDISYNRFTELKVNYCSALKTLNASHNQIESYVAPETNVLENLDLSDNKFTLATLPIDALAMGDNFDYAPQHNISISPKAPGVDLSNQNITIDGKITQYAWKKLDGTVLVNGVDYTGEGGAFNFINTECGAIYCEISHEAFPQFAGDNVLRTTNVEPSLIPTNLVAKFVTPTGGQTATLSLASTQEKSTIFIDWNGDGTGLEQYTLGNKYTTFEAITVAGREVKVYTYDEDDYLKVFSITGATISSFDGSNMKYVTTLTLDGTSISDEQLILPSTSLLELSIQNGKLTKMDISKYPELVSVRLTGNKITSFDISANKKLWQVAVERNNLTEFKADKNYILGDLFLGQNQLESIDLTQTPGLQQLNLYDNKLSSINARALTYPLVLNIDRNYFRLSTLPLDLRSTCYNFVYTNQAEVSVELIDHKVDLSSEAVIDGYETVYRWWVGKPVLNTESGELEGEELYRDDEYFIENGVTRFNLSTAIKNLVCTMQNERFPNTIIYTKPFDCSGINDVKVDDENAPVEYFNLQGQRIDNPASGTIVIRRQGATVTKEVIK